MRRNKLLHLEMAKLLKSRSSIDEFRKKYFIR